MPKNIVFCADGTWNHPADRSTVLPCDTNVYKFYKALSISPDQVPYYDDGVGTGGTPVDHLLGGALGEGLFQKIKDGYTFIAHAYEPGDQIFLIGFSRGAYTARSLAGMIAACGIPEQLSSDSIEDSFDAYRQGSNRTAAVQALKSNYGNTDADVVMVGVWDTVGALGIPGPVFSAVDDARFGFLDTKLHPNIRAAYQALSIDSRRPEFVPTLWDPLPPAGDATIPQVLKQVWFAGVHCDVGGGYNETGLSDITLSWIIKNALSHGVQFDSTALDRYHDIDGKHALDTSHESWTAFWGFPKSRQIAPSSTISRSVGIRIAEMSNYRPRNLSVAGSNLAASYSIEETVSGYALAADA